MIYMKARYSHYINKAVFMLCFCPLLLIAVGAHAQSPYDETIALNPFFSSSNTAGIRGQLDKTVIMMPNTGNVRKAVSYAKLYGGYETGGFRNSDGASALWGGGANAATILHLPKVSMTGSFSFSQADGKDMCGSMFINPGYYPVDVVEFTPGRKTLQEYGFSGGFSSDISAHWLAGGRIDFKSANFSKRRDIRHTNYSLDLTATPSVVYKAGQWNFGLSYIFRKTSEYTKAEKLGTATADTYYAFLDKGLMWGTYQMWSGNGLHLAEAGVDRFPVKEITHGVGVQIQHRKGFYIDAEYRSSNGEVGEKGFVWYKFPRRELSAGLSYIIIRPKAGHKIGLKYSSSAGLNKESVIDKVTEGGITTPTVYGYNTVLKHNRLCLNAFYDLYFNGKLELHCSMDYSYDKKVSTSVYPFYDTESFNALGVNALGLYRFGRFELEAALGFYGGYEWQRKEENSGSAGLETEPFRLEERYDIWKEYLIAPRVTPELGLRFFVSGNYVKGIYVGAKAYDTHAFGLRHISGNDRFNALFELGYRF